MKNHSPSSRVGLSAALLVIGVVSALHAQNIITFDVPNSISTQPAAINSAGQVTGSYWDANGSHGFLRQADGKFTRFDVPNNFSGLVVTGVTSMNAAGEIVGYILTLDTDSYHSFLRQTDGTFILLNAPGPCQAPMATKADLSSWAVPLLSIDGVVFTGINNRGQITGVYGEVLCHRSFLRQPDGTIISFGVAPDAVPGPNTIAQAINLRGQTTGYYLDNHTFRGFLREPDGTITTFAAADSDTYPTAIAPRGEITGYAGGHGFLRQRNGSIVTFDAPNSLATQPTAINQKGQIAGFCLDANYVYHGFLREQNGSFMTVDVPNSTNTYPAAMNAKGQMTGWYSDASGGVHGFVSVASSQTCTSCGLLN